MNIHIDKCCKIQARLCLDQGHSVLKCPRSSVFFVISFLSDGKYYSYREKQTQTMKDKHTEEVLDFGQALEFEKG